MARISGDQEFIDEDPVLKSTWRTDRGKRYILIAAVEKLLAFTRSSISVLPIYRSTGA